jgi:hypothetical protein
VERVNSVNGKWANREKKLIACPCQSMAVPTYEIQYLQPGSPGQPLPTTSWHFYQWVFNDQSSQEGARIANAISKGRANIETLLEPDPTLLLLLLALEPSSLGAPVKGWARQDWQEWQESFDKASHACKATPKSINRQREKN